MADKDHDGILSIAELTHFFEMTYASLEQVSTALTAFYRVLCIYS